jgi:hypothetical protein
MIHLNMRFNDDPEVLICMASAMVAVVAIYIFFFAKSAKVKRNMRRILQKNIPEIEDGELVKVAGSVQLLGKRVIAPLSGRECSYWHVKVNARRRGAKGSSASTIINEEEAGDIILKNGQHYILVVAAKLNAFLLRYQHYSSGYKNDPTGSLEKYLKKHKETGKDKAGENKEIDYAEAALEAGVDIAVTGTAEWKSASEFKLNLPVNKVLVIKDWGGNTVYLTDDPRMFKKL